MTISDEHRITKSLIQKGSHRSSSPLTLFINWKTEVQEAYALSQGATSGWWESQTRTNVKTQIRDPAVFFHEIMFVKLSEKYKVWSGCIIWILNWVQIIWIPNLKEPKLNVCANLFSKPYPNANKKWMKHHCLRVTEHFRTLLLILRNVMKKHQAVASNTFFLCFLPKMYVMS